MKPKVNSSVRVLAVLLGVAVAFGVIGVVLAASSVNVARVDNFATGPDSLILTVPNDTAQILSGTSYATVTQALGAYRTVELTGTFAAFRNGARVRYSVNTGGKTLGVSSDTGGTPKAKIKWDNTNDPLSLNPSGLGGVDLISGTNTGFVIEFQQIDVSGASLAVRVYSGTSSSVYTLAMPSVIPSGSHVDYFMPFSVFAPELGSGVFFTSVGAIVWDLSGVDSLDFEVTNYETDNVQDFGDLPDSYGTLSASDGPRHTVNFLRLGRNVDSEVDGQPVGTTALGDDTDGNAPYLPGDEEGVTRGPRLAGTPPLVNWRPGAVFGGFGGSVDVVVNGPCSSSDLCHLRGWIDWNGNSVLESSEVVITGTGFWNGEFSNPGTSRIYFDIPPSPACFGGTCYARFRLCGGVGGASDCDSPKGSSATGEVEDYAWVFGTNAVTLESLQAQSTTSPIVPVALIGVSALALIGVVFVVRRRKTA
jgi:hypothetical protein